MTKPTSVGDGSHLYLRQPGLVLAFHGCDEKVGEAVLRGEKKHLSPSKNAYDWLGDGIYFWEHDPLRAHEFALEASKGAKHSQGAIKKPFVIGAVIDLGLCCNLMHRAAVEELRRSHEFLEQIYQSLDFEMPVNKGVDEAVTLRFLDRAVVQHMHSLRTQNGLDPYQSVRAVFFEGKRLWQGAGMRERNHVQIAIRDVSCIRGYFRPLSTPFF